MFRLSSLPAGWPTRLADIASIAFLAGLVVIMLVLLGRPANPSLEGTYWQLEAVAGHPVKNTAHDPAYLQLLPARGQLRGEFDGQTLIGHYQQLGVPRQLHLDPQALGRSQPTSARSASVASQNRRYLKALTRTRGETIDGTQLVLRDANGRALAQLKALQRG